jgi:hypothetical protein
MKAELKYSFPCELTEELLHIFIKSSPVIKGVFSRVDLYNATVLITHISKSQIEWIIL